MIFDEHELRTRWNGNENGSGGLFYRLGGCERLFSVKSYESLLHSDNASLLAIPESSSCLDTFDVAHNHTEY